MVRDLTEDSIKRLDDDVKIAILGALKIIDNLPKQNRNWETVMHQFMQTPLLSHEKAVDNTDYYKKQDLRWFEFDGSPSAPVVRKILAWFDNVMLHDHVLLDAFYPNATFLAQIVAATGSTVQSVEDIIVKKEFYSRKLMNIGILQFPDLKYP